MRVVHALAVAIASLGACAGDGDEGPFRPGGGGGGGGSHGGDGGVIDAATGDGAGDGDGGSALNGRICVVSDLRVPDACPSVAAQSGVPVLVRGTTTSTVSGSDGKFTLAVSSSSVVLDVATGTAGLERAYVPAVVGGEVKTPVVTTAAFDAAINSLTTAVPDGNGTVVAYVVDTNGPAVGVTFSTIAGSSHAPWYDAGSNTSWQQGTGTGDRGVALFVDVPAGTVSIDGTAADSRVAQLSGIPVAVDTVTFVRVTLVAPP
jgi:hypothetical protein